MIESLPLHPKLVHFPMALAVLVPLFSAALLIAWWKAWLPARAWLIAVALQVLLAATAFMAMRSGEADEEVVESVVAESVIEEHEEAAEVFLWAAAGVLVLFVGAAALPKRGLPIAALATLASVAVLGLGIRVGNAGGALVYQHGAAAAHVPSAGAAGSVSSGSVAHADDDDEDDEHEEHEEHDDD